MNSKGQTIVETAIILPILLILVLGIFEFGRAMYVKNTLNNAARAGARAAVVLPLYDATTNPNGLQTVSNVPLNSACGSSGVNKSVYDIICGSLTNGIPRNDSTAVSIAAFTSYSTATSSPSPNDRITVTLTWSNYPTLFNKAIPVVGNTNVTIMGSGLTLTGQASMRYE
ncbi:MAG: hypothetical protein CXR31_06160 [Geobacter sp.]|nr:MAG: hypothetical protein CXR31_06160 [Geobacter sp.]